VTGYAEQSILAYAAVRVAEMLRVAGVSQRQLAKMLKVSDARVSQILSGKANPTVRSLARLADALGFTMHITFAANDKALRQEAGAFHRACGEAERNLLRERLRELRELLDTIATQGACRCGVLKKHQQGCPRWSVPALDGIEELRGGD
jgi:transcriptional regulator with XRE-family HTH domain